MSRDGFHTHLDQSWDHQGGKCDVDRCGCKPHAQNQGSNHGKHQCNPQVAAREADDYISELQS